MHEPGSSTELDLARQELAELERAMEELPQILEERFRQRLCDVRHINHQLLMEQASLESRLAESSLGLWRTQWQALLVAVLVGTALVGLGWGASRQLGFRPSALRQAPVNGDRLQAAAPLSASILQVQAQGSSWLEVQDLRSQAVLFIGVLEAGQSRTIRLRHGLRLRSGRPDLLTIRIDDGQPEPFGLSHGQDWRTVMPPELRTAGA